MAQPVSPCKGCAERTPTCHARCEKYLAFASAREEFRARMYHEKYDTYNLARVDNIQKNIKKRYKLRSR